MIGITYRPAVNEALIEEMERDPNTFLMGEEVAEYNGTRVDTVYGLTVGS